MEVASIPSSGSRRCAEPFPFFALGKHGIQLRLRHLARVGLQDAGVRFQYLPQRPEGDSLPVRQTSTLPPRDEILSGIDEGAELGHDPALAQARLAYHRYELNGIGGDGLLEEPFKSARSISRPTNGVSRVRVRSVPNLALAARAWNTRTDSDFPFRLACSNSS